MLSRARLVLPSALIALALAGCGPSSSTPAQTEVRANAATSPAAEAEPEQAVPVVACDEPTFEFGSVAPSESVTHVFKLQNRGTADLHIERVQRT